MKIFYLAKKDIQIIMKDKGKIINLIILPIIYILLLTGGLQGTMSQSPEKPIILPVVNLDKGGAIAENFIKKLDNTSGIQVKLYDQAKVQLLLKEVEIDRFLTIPTDFSAKLAENNTVTITLVNHPDTEELRNQSILRIINGVIQRISQKTQFLASLNQMGDMLAISPPEYQVFTPEKNLVRAKKMFERSESRPLVVLKQVRPENVNKKMKKPNAVQQIVPGFAILFVFLAAQATAFSMYQEKREGTFRRLIAAPISKASILIGKMIPNFLTAIIQVLIMFSMGIFFFPLLGMEGLILGEDILALAVVTIILALCSTGMGVLIAAIAKTESQIGGMGTLALWAMGAVGGCLFPQFLLGGFLDTIGKMVPHYWAVQAYQDLIVRGQSFYEVITAMFVLLTFTLIFFIIGLWRFEFD